MENPAIYVRHLIKSFGGKEVLKDINLTVDKGDNVIVLGRSGTGKSVLIKCMVRLLEPDSGEIKMLDKDISKLDSDELDKLRTRIGFLFQSNALYDSMNVEENLAFPLRRQQKETDEKELAELTQEMLENVGLPKTAKMMPSELSGGMKKRIALARTLMLRPEIILYDEPTTGLDPITAREISRLIVKMQEKYKVTSIVITHDMNCVEVIGGRICILIDGIFKADGTFEELSKSDDENIRAFFGITNAEPVSGS